MKWFNFVLGLLLVAFIVLKVAGVIAWSWALVLIPIWIYLGIILLDIILLIIYYILGGDINKI